MPKALTCPNCGAPLEAKDDALQIKCEFCGTPIMLTGEIRRPRPEEIQRNAPPPPSPQIIVQQNAIDLSDLVVPQVRARRGMGCFGCFTSLFFTVLSFGVAFAMLIGTNTISTSTINEIVTQMPPPIMTMVQGALNSINASSPTTATRPSVSIPVVNGRTATPNPTVPGSSENIEGRVIGDTSDPNVPLFGGEGTGLGKFSDARHLAVSTDGRIYVTDVYTKRVQRFLPDGTFDVMFEVKEGQNDYAVWAIAADRNFVYMVVEGALVQYSAESGRLVRQFGGSDDFQDVVVAPNGNVYALANDSWTGDRIMIFNSDGRRVDQFEDNVAGVVGDTTIFDHFIAADGLGNVFIYRSFDYFVYQFSPQGRYVDRFGGQGTPQDPDKLSSPLSIGIDSQGNIYVADFGGIKVFEPDGRFIRKIEVGIGPLRDFGFNLNDEMYVIAGNSVHRVKVN
jgi:DNA-directed RNA polymerase subunit RPC12/RpoP